MPHRKTEKVKTSEDETLQGTIKLQVGDSVRVTLPIDVLKLLSETEGGGCWNDDMKPVSYFSWFYVGTEYIRKQHETENNTNMVEML